MSKADIKNIRAGLEVADELKKYGIEFVPLPVMDETDRIKLWGIMSSRLEKLEKEATEVEKATLKE